MTYHALYHGAGSTHNRGFEQYPAAPLHEEGQLQAAAHSAPALFSNVRLFDFSRKERRFQDGLQRYIRRIDHDQTPFATGDLIGALIIPAKALLVGFSWEVEIPQAGVGFTAKTHFNTDLDSVATIDGSTKGSGCIWLPASQKQVWFENNDGIDLEITAWPTTIPDDLRFWVSAIYVNPKLGA